MTRCRAETLFLELIDRDSSLWPDLLEERCAGDAALRREVEALLEADRAGWDPIDPRQILTGESATQPASEPWLNELSAGSVVGAYSLGELLGEGGFGVVYRAEQTAPFARSVAIKILKLGMDTEQVIRRFEAEREVLAKMDHPNIARVLDAGAMPNGRLYFVMELVTGRTITDYCDRGGLSIAERLGVVLQVCRAVQHAHQRGVIHRDLKPSNILVSESDGRPLVKVIDFGIARAIQRPAEGEDLMTRVGQLLGTPEHMSPEQAEGALAIDTRSDVYAIGVVLYEILTGDRPFRFPELRGTNWGEIRRILREVDPVKPSARLTRSNERRKEIAACRRTDPASLEARLQGDLDWIVMKALAKEPERRYGSVQALSDDLQRHLAGLPVEAAPPSRRYLLGKMIRRRRGLVTSVGLLLGALVTGTIGTTWGMLRAQSAEQRQSELRSAAETERDRARTVARFLRNTFSAVDPEVARGRDTRLLESLMDLATERLERGELQRDPEAATELELTIGSVYTHVGRYEDAERLIGIARHRVAGDEDADPLMRAWAAAEAAYLADVRGDLAGAESLYREAISGIRGDRPEVVELLCEMYAGLGHVAQQQARHTDAVVMHETAMAYARRIGGRDLLVELSNLASALKMADRFEDAERAYDELMPLLSVDASDDLITAAALSNRGALRSAQQRLPEALADLSQALEIKRHVYGDRHPELVLALSNLAVVYSRAGRAVEAEELLREALDIAEEAWPQGHPQTATALDGLGVTLVQQGDPAAAAPYLEESVAMCRRLSGEASLEVAGGLTNLAQCLSALGRAEEAETRALEALSIAEKIFEENDPRRIAILDVVGRLAQEAGHHESAVDAFRRALNARRLRTPTSNPDVDSNLAQLGLALLQLEELGAAREAEEHLRESYELRIQRLTESDWRTANARCLLGLAIVQQLELSPSMSSNHRGEGLEEAQALLGEGFEQLLEVAEAIPARVRAKRLGNAANALARLHAVWEIDAPRSGHAEQSEAWRLRAKELSGE